jgi:hypothetical protein
VSERCEAERGREEERGRERKREEERKRDKSTTYHIAREATHTYSI